MAPAHSARAERQGRARTWLSVSAIVLVLGIAGATALVPTTIAATPAAAATHGPLRVSLVTPSGQNVAPDSPVEVRFNNPLAVDSPLPWLVPHVRGTWVRLSPKVVGFRAAAPFMPDARYVIVVPAAMTAIDGKTLRSRVERAFVVQPGSMLRLNQLLAELGYLPLRFEPTGPFSPDSGAVQHGVFAWRWSNVPVELSQLWRPDAFTVVTEGALMRFEDVEGLPTTGVATAPVWSALLNAVAKGRTDPQPYGYVIVSQTLPETLTLYVNNHVIYTSLVNTGISSRPTAVATTPVYLRYTVTTMSGTNPDGSHYADPGIPWVSYFLGGEALHGFIRGSYGWPQSLGCVEMPFANAAVVWPHTPIGTLVTVT